MVNGSSENSSWVKVTREGDATAMTSSGEEKDVQHQNSKPGLWSCEEDGGKENLG